MTKSNERADFAVGFLSVQKDVYVLSYFLKKGVDRINTPQYTLVFQWRHWQGQLHSHLHILGLDPGKEVSAMSLVVTIDWKFVVALGAATVGTIFAVKMDASAAERISIHAIDAGKEYAVAVNSNC